MASNNRESTKEILKFPGLGKLGKKVWEVMSNLKKTSDSI